MEKSNFAIWLAVNEDGDSVVSMDGASDAREALVDEWGGQSIRTVKIEVTMALPTVPEMEVDVADDAGETEDVDAEVAA